MAKKKMNKGGPTGLSGVPSQESFEFEEDEKLEPVKISPEKCMSCGAEDAPVLIEHYKTVKGSLNPEANLDVTVRDHINVCEKCWHVGEALKRLEKNIVFQVRGGTDARDAAKTYTMIAAMLDWHLTGTLDFEESRLRRLAELWGDM